MSTTAAAVPELTRAAMTLAGLAYGFPENLPTYLRRDDLATRGRWRATWVPEERDGFFAFAAADDDGRTAIAVRGTNPGATREFFLNVLDDVDVWRSSRWDKTIEDGAMISNGARRGLDTLLTLTAGGETLLDHVARLPDGATVVVTGHSLGGCLASVLALELARRFPGRDVRPITFAAPSAGNARFCDNFQQAFPHAERYFNRLDLVPMAWHDLDRLGSLYDAPGPRCPAWFRSLAGEVRGRLAQHGYTQPGPGTPLPLTGDPAIRYERGTVAAFFDRLLRRGIYFAEALHQHMPDTYLEHLGAPKLPFHLPLRWVWRDLTRRLRPRRAAAGPS
jgi:dienelactone hydrolase